MLLFWKYWIKSASLLRFYFRFSSLDPHCKTHPGLQLLAPQEWKHSPPFGSAGRVLHFLPLLQHFNVVYVTFSMQMIQMIPFWNDCTGVADAGHVRGPVGGGDIRNAV